MRSNLYEYFLIRLNFNVIVYQSFHYVLLASLSSCWVPFATTAIVHEVPKMAKKKDSEKSSQNSDNVKNSKAQQGDDDEPNFSDPEGYVDPISDEGI